MVTQRTHVHHHLQTGDALHAGQGNHPKASKASGTLQESYGNAAVLAIGVIAPSPTATELSQ